MTASPAASFTDVFAEVERLDPIAGEIELAKLMVETNFRSVTLEIGRAPDR